MNNAPIYDRSKRKPSTFSVPQTPQPMRDKATTPPQPKSEQPKPQQKPPVEIDMFLNLARRDSATVDISLVSGKEYVGATIKYVERYMLVIQHEGKEIGIMKTAIASVSRYIKAASESSEEAKR
jgi:sRNA-binding regulator protein Hfq